MLDSDERLDADERELLELESVDCELCELRDELLDELSEDSLDPLLDELCGVKSIVMQNATNSKRKDQCRSTTVLSDAAVSIAP